MALIDLARDHAGKPSRAIQIMLISLMVGLLITLAVLGGFSHISG